MPAAAARTDRQETQGSDLDIPEQTGKRYKMRVLRTTYMVGVSGHSGRFHEGDVVLVDEPTALRWFEHGVAEPAPKDARTVGEINADRRRDEFRRRAEPVEGVFDAMVSRRDAPGGQGRSRPDSSQERQLMPPQMPVPNRRGRGNPNLEGAGVINSTDDEDE